ncbi:hypothetical protein B14911_11162 [Bacillus sp. NRRL B-14911]|uniref:Uncharacterized protein n=2 Tax=Bacillus infantis TaxID=324767 RepID=U5LAH4_9BACI|nr:hypothetical protein N288_08895 [Bacillus infantis NRRL B-14911]EAR64819.1 hypothetical protein B14911_11162 [Bacillus sp. NRRL B-14911]
MMKSLQDSIYNWLTIKVVCDARPEDTAAAETEEMFKAILTEDLKLSEIEAVKEADFYTVFFTDKNERRSFRFPAELIDVMLDQINEEPEKYPNFPL